MPEELAPSSSGEREVVSAASASAASKNLMDQIEKMMMDEEYIVEANPASVAGALMKSINVLAEMFGKSINVEQDFKFSVGKRSYALAGMIESEGKKWGLEIPAIKTFDRSGGVAAFYALKRLTDAVSTNTIFGGVFNCPERELLVRNL